MRLLLDTHVILWWMTGDRRLAAAPRALIASPDNEVLVSAASFWEIAVKRQLRRIEVDLVELHEAAAADGMTELPVDVAHALRLRSLPDLHRDPFDRMLIAQAIETGARLLTRDEQVLAYAGTEGFEPLKA